MNRSEVNKLLAFMKANYSYAFKHMSHQEKCLLLESWTFALQDIDAEIVFMAAMQLLSVSKWLPTVAELREQVKQLHYEALYAWGPMDAPTQEQVQATEYIAGKTRHLADGNSRETELRLTTMLAQPAFCGIYSGKGMFAALGDARYEIEEAAT